MLLRRASFCAVERFEHRRIVGVVPVVFVTAALAPRHETRYASCRRAVVLTATPDRLRGLSAFVERFVESALHHFTITAALVAGPARPSTASP